MPTRGEAALVDQVNRLRRNRGLAPLSYSARLSRGALTWARSLAAPRAAGRLGHDPRYWPAAQSACVRVRAGAENVAGREVPAGAPRQEQARVAAQGFVRQYRESLPHRVNMLDPAATHVGVATVFRRRTQGGFYAANVLRFARAASC